MTLETTLLKRLQQNPEHRAQIGGRLLDALVDVALTSDYNTSFPSAPLGRYDAQAALNRLNLALEEASKVVPTEDQAPQVYEKALREMAPSQLHSMRAMAQTAEEVALIEAEFARRGLLL